MSLTGSISPLSLPDPPLYLIENLVFKDRNIQLDGYRFKNCAFVGCTLHTSSGRFKIEECFFQGDWYVSFSGNALNVIRLTSVLDTESAGSEYRAIVHPNGGVSVV